MTAGSGSTGLFLLVTGTGILMGAGGALVANAWFMTLLFNCE
ncbi:putative membrane protein [Bacteroides fragilis str. 3976T8]|uniref:Putative membrane protein n=1 Tax=Bacteroides fragilis str. 3976T8 TaxID=1339314 RepID=A0A016CJ29_BACFG|nr:putative membrane protein [Bacteroides fragilis str. 3976T8]